MEKLKRIKELCKEYTCRDCVYFMPSGDFLVVMNILKDSTINCHYAYDPFDYDKHSADKLYVEKIFWINDENFGKTEQVCKYENPWYTLVYRENNIVDFDYDALHIDFYKTLEGAYLMNKDSDLKMSVISKQYDEIFCSSQGFDKDQFINFYRTIQGANFIDIERKRPLDDIDDQANKKQKIDISIT
uniref:Uncharacterized protein n=1 Tax=viral metagenome TaxID=1070528 RepID=A0A6C0EC86_9ZZZZ